MVIMFLKYHRSLKFTRIKNKNKKLMIKINKCNNNNNIKYKIFKIKVMNKI